MNKIILYAVTITIIVIHSSCLTSLQPLTTADNVTKENRAPGTWQYNNNQLQVDDLTKSELFSYIKNSIINKGSHPGPLSKKDREDSIYYSKAYMISFEKDNAHYYYSAGFTRIGNDLFMDLFPVLVDDSINENSSYSPFSIEFTPTFTIAKAEFANENTLVLKFLNGDFIKEQIINGNMRIKHEEDKLFGSFLITASTYDLTQFLSKYSHDERLYGQKNTVTLTRKLL